jgi:hypothetical protein
MQWIPIGGTDPLPDHVHLKQKLLDDLLCGNIHPSDFFTVCGLERNKLALRLGLEAQTKKKWDVLRAKYPAITGDANIDSYIHPGSVLDVKRIVETLYRNMKSADAETKRAEMKAQLGALGFPKRGVAVEADEDVDLIGENTD